MKEPPILYSSGCPKCGVLKKKLDEKHLEYIENNDTEMMINLGIDQVPVLCVDGMYLEFKEAVDWVNSQ